MLISNMKQSRYLKAADVDPERVVTIKAVAQENVGPESGPEQIKWVLHTHELDKALVLNWTNIQLIARVTGSQDTDHWPGKQIILWNDESVQFHGEIVGGVRVRQAPKKPTPVEAAPFDDDIPFV